MTPAPSTFYDWNCMGGGLMVIWGTCLRTGTRGPILGEPGFTDRPPPNKAV